MPEPTIQDILNIKADPELGTGTPAVVYDSRNLINTLNQAAQLKAENDWRKYNMFMGNLKDVYKDLNEIAKQPVLTEDRDKLKNTMAEIVKGISGDPRGFFSGGPKYQETLGKLTQLQTETTESKQNNLYDAAHRQYFYANPELDTPDNRALVDSYRKGQLGARSPYMLKLPGIFDPKVLSDQLKLSSMSKTATETVDGKGHTDKIVKQDVDPTKWAESAKAFYYSADKRGNPVVETVKKQYEQLPASVKTKYANSADPVFDYYMDLLNAYKPMPEVTQTLEADQAWQTKQQIAEQERVSKRSATTQIQLGREGHIAAREGQGWKRIDSDVDEEGLPIEGIEKDQYGNLWIPGEKLKATIDYTKRRGTTGTLTGALSGPPEEFWDKEILPQISGQMLDPNGKQIVIEANFTGDKEVDPTQIENLAPIFKGHYVEGQKQDNISELKIRYKNGKPTALIIDGTPYGKAGINTEMTNYQNKSKTQGGDLDLYR